MIYKMSQQYYDLLRRKIKPHDLKSTRDTETRRYFFAPHDSLTPHRWIIWHINQMLGLPENTITEVVTYEN